MITLWLGYSVYKKVKEKEKTQIYNFSLPKYIWNHNEFFIEIFSYFVCVGVCECDQGKGSAIMLYSKSESFMFPLKWNLLWMTKQNSLIWNSQFLLYCLIFHSLFSICIVYFSDVLQNRKTHTHIVVLVLKIKIPFEICIFHGGKKCNWEITVFFFSRLNGRA